MYPFQFFFIFENSCFGTCLNAMAKLYQVNVLMMGAANILWVPLANTFGRRPITLFNILLLTLCCVWAARATSFGSLLAARFFMGVGVAPADTSKSLRPSYQKVSMLRVLLVAPNVVGEIYFAHQRGKAMVGYIP